MNTMATAPADAEDFSGIATSIYTLHMVLLWTLTSHDEPLCETDTNHLSAYELGSSTGIVVSAVMENRATKIKC